MSKNSNNDTFEIEHVSGEAFLSGANKDKVLHDTFDGPNDGVIPPLKGYSLSGRLGNLEKKIKQQMLIDDRRKESFFIEELLQPRDQWSITFSFDLITSLKNRIIDTNPMPVNHLCEYTRDYVQRVLNIPRLQDYGFKIKVA